MEVFGELKACYQPSVCLHAYQRRARSANLINMLVICAKLHFPFSRVRVNGSHKTKQQKKKKER